MSGLGFQQSVSFQQQPTASGVKGDHEIQIVPAVKPPQNADIATYYARSNVCHLKNRTMKKRAPFPSHSSLLYVCVYVAVIVYCGDRLFPAIIYLEERSRTCF